jgi:hypothetical protein
MAINKLFSILLMMVLSISVSAMQIFVDVPVDRTITLDVEQSDSIANVKAQIEAEEGVPAAQQKLFFGAQELLDEWTLADYNIQDGSTLTLSLQSVFIDITEFENGYLTFPNVDQSLYYRIEFKPNLAESELWDGMYRGLRNIQSSDPEVTVPVGVFYRVVGRDTPWFGGTAVAADILSGKTAYVDDLEVTGTMPNVGQQNVMPGTASQTIAQGYHDGTGAVDGDADLAAGNIVTGVTIFGVAGGALEASGNAEAQHVLTGLTFSRDGAVDVSGTMPNVGQQNVMPGTASQTIAQGYHDGTGAVDGDADLTAGNIVTGVTIFGVAGGALEASGNAEAQHVLTGLTFSRDGAVDVSGTMSNVGQQNVMPGTASQTIAQGYHDGTGTVDGDADLAAGNIVTGVTIFGVAGGALEASGTAEAQHVLTGLTFSRDGAVDVSGTMPSVGQQNVMPGTASQTIAQGYHDGTGAVDGDADLMAGNIAEGVTIFGVAGTYKGFALVPKTGQGATESDRLRDDGNLQAGTAWPSPRFTDNGDQTVTDNLTGLMWTKHSNLPGGPRSWVDAVDYCTNMNTGSGTYGYTDWRLPNVREMQSLIDYGSDFPAMPEVHPFTDVVSGEKYWSSSTFSVFPDLDHSWSVDLRRGRVDHEDKTLAYYVWPVRGGP